MFLCSSILVFLLFLPACLVVVTSSHHSLCAQKLKEADFQFQATTDWQPQKQDYCRLHERGGEYLMFFTSLLQHVPYQTQDSLNTQHVYQF